MYKKLVDTVFWSDINNTDYMVSHTGKVRRDKNFVPVTYVIENNRYVNLNIGIDVVPVPIAWLVAEAFVENPKKYTILRFKDNDSTNRHFTNLEWVEKLGKGQIGLVLE